MTTSKENLSGKTLFISGASRGIGLAIALRAARDGANIIVAAKTTEPNPKLAGTIFSAAAEIEAAGGQALPLVCDVRFPEQIKSAIDAGVARFGGIDILVNNASAIDLSPTLAIDPKRYALMQAINRDGTFYASRFALEHLRKGRNPHILTLSPPLTHMAKWLGIFPAYASSKFGMSLITQALAGEQRKAGIGVNSLWPRTLIATAAVAHFEGGADKIAHSRKPEIVADAAYAILTRDSRVCTGNFFIDDLVLAEEGITDLSDYAVTPGLEPYKDIFLD